MEVTTEPGENVTPAELVEFFMGTGVSAKCPTCNYEHSGIQVDDSAALVRVVANEYCELQPTGKFARVGHTIFPTVLTSCDNCGYVRSFSLIKINSWLNAKHPERRLVR